VSGEETTMAMLDWRDRGQPALLRARAWLREQPDSATLEAGGETLNTTATVGEGAVAALLEHEAPAPRPCIRPAPLFRSGRKNKRTLYRLDPAPGEMREECVGFLDEAHSEEIITMLNEASEARDAGNTPERTWNGSDPAPCQDCAMLRRQVARGVHDADESKIDAERHRSDAVRKDCTIQALRTELDRWKNCYLDKPEDRLYHASDRTWWRRDDSHWAGIGSLVRAEPPEGLVAEPTVPSCGVRAVEVPAVDAAKHWEDRCLAAEAEIVKLQRDLESRTETPFRRVVIANDSRFAGMRGEEVRSGRVRITVTVDPKDVLPDETSDAEGFTLACKVCGTTVGVVRCGAGSFCQPCASATPDPWRAAPPEKAEDSR
jgi:hypothetical protein